jgi:glycosyltransferase involved in cell wall biosynthesis
MSIMASAGNGRRVLIVVHNLPVPFDRRVWLEATTLTAHGYLVSVICPKTKGYDATYERLEGIDIFRYPVPLDAHSALGFIIEFAWGFLLTSFLSLRVVIAGRGFDVLHVCNPPEIYWPLGWFWRLFGRNFIFDHHDLSPEMFAVKFGRQTGTLHRALLFLERRTFEVADIVIATNESHKEIAVLRGGKRPEDVIVVRSGPELSRFRRYDPDRGWRHGKEHLLVFLGEICKQDGVDHLVRAIAILRNEIGRDDFHCIFVGGGPYQPMIVRYAAELGIADLCTFTGRVSDDVLCRILSSAHVAVDPDPKNAWSDKSTMNKVIEYMYFGLPIVCYDLREARVSAGAAALYVTPNSEAALAKGIDDLLLDAERSARMGRIGRRRVRETFAWEHSKAPLLAAYDRVFARLPTAGRHRQAERGPATAADKAHRGGEVI